MSIVNVHDAKTHLSKLLERVHAGEEIILAKNGKPYARLVPLGRPRKRVPGQLKGKIGSAFFKPLPEEDLRMWESEATS